MKEAIVATVIAIIVLIVALIAFFDESDSPSFTSAAV
jgi:hypothetical protein